MFAPPLIRRALALAALCAAFAACTDTEAPISPRPDAEAETDSFLPPTTDFAFNDARVAVDDFGEPCEVNEDCLVGYCVEAPEGGRVCTRRCGECPVGWECNPVGNLGPDRTFICTADQPDLCKPCSNHRDCDDNADLCLSIGRGRYCGEDCANGRACPDGFECAAVTVTGADGDPVDAEQCIPANNAGCASCVDVDGDGYGRGEDCLGSDCDDSNPDVYEGAPELCDGLDNNCNARTDEANLLDAPPDDVGCLDEGVCRGSPVICQGGEWACNYPASYDEGTEVRCDGIDNDCDGSTDEDFDHQVDPAHCGQCNNACRYDNALGVCDTGRCLLGDCLEGWHNANGNDGDGCEYGPCQLSNGGVEQCDGIDNDCDGGVDEDIRRPCGQDVGQCRAGFQGCVDGELTACEGAIGPTNEVCDGLDNDCDGMPDEGFGVLSDVNNCGRCGFVCELPDATPRCAEGTCRIDTCAPGYWDNNGVAGDGCEYPCNLNNGGVEACNASDDDCDGRADEGIDLDLDPNNCGACGRRCEYANAQAACVQRVCGLGACLPGFHDIDRDPANGCEYACVPQGEDDLPDPGFVDADCDGIDGEIEDAIFVAPRGNDVNEGTPQAPVGTLARAMDLALAANPPKYIIAAEGVFEGTLTIRAGVHIYGGYRPGARWVRSAEYETIIRGGAQGLIADNLAGPASLTRLSIESTTPNQPGASSHSVWVRNSAPTT
ncbi:MAG: MopE-related protein [bacterium]